MGWLRSLLRAAIKAGIATKVLDELRKPENRAKLHVVGARIAAEARKPENRERVRRAARAVTSKVRRSPSRP